jgi:tetratricopeptide (TPR) repeat protein
MRSAEQWTGAKEGSTRRRGRSRARRPLLWLAAVLALAGLVLGGLATPTARESVMRRASLSVLEQQVRAHPDDWLLQYWVGRKRAAAERLDGAKAAYRRAVDLRPDSAPAWAGLGEVLRRLGQMDEAVNSLNAGLRHDPRCGAALASLAVIDASRGDPARALEEAQRAANMSPDDAACWYALGFVHVQLDQPGRAVSYLRKAAQRAPEEARYQQLLGEALRDLGQLDAAQPILARAVVLAPTYAPAHLSLGQLYAARPPVGTYLPLAVQELEQARELAPGDWAPHYHLGRVYLRQGRFRTAAAELQRVAQLAPDFDPALLDLSRAYAGLGKREEAKRLLASFEAASANYQAITAARLRSDHDPKNPALHFELARLLIERGHNRAAYAELQAGLALAPRNAWAVAAARRLLSGKGAPAGTGP